MEKKRSKLRIETRGVQKKNQREIREAKWGKTEKSKNTVRIVSLK